MNCPRCGSGIPAGATFCLQCGQMFVAAAGGATALPVVAKRNILPFVLGALGAVIAVFGGLWASGLLSFGNTPPETVLRVPAKEQSVGLARRGEQQEPSIARAGVRMPDDVRAWLEHLERIEKKKNDLHAEQLSDATVT